VCFSCAPGYIYFTYSSPFCGFDSPFYQCIVGYTLDFQNKRCLPTTITSDYNGCFATVSSCQVCLFQSTVTCVTCQSGTFLYNNQCLLSCPNLTWAYNNVCIENNPYDPKCITQGISSNSSFNYVNATIVADSTVYPYYTQ
jgi:hypothetical protein